MEQPGQAERIRTLVFGNCSCSVRPWSWLRWSGGFGARWWSISIDRTIAGVRVFFFCLLIRARRNVIGSILTCAHNGKASIIHPIARLHISICKKKCDRVPFIGTATADLVSIIGLFIVFFSFFLACLQKRNSQLCPKLGACLGDFFFCKKLFGLILISILGNKLFLLLSAAR